MKKLLLVLLVVAMAAFLFVGCLPTTPPAEGEGEGEGECEVTVEIDGAVVVDGKDYVSCGTHDITVTFCAPVVGYVEAWISCCWGDYSPDGVYSKDNGDGMYVVLFPNADRTVWTGSGYFGEDCDKDKNGGWTPCCASYVSVWAGECEDEACIWFPVIVDCDDPFAEIEITVEPDEADDEECPCEGCEITFESIVDPEVCDPDIECCGDYCSGLTGWSVVLYDADPFDVCCDPNVCEEPIGSCSGTECPILCVTECLEASDDPYYAVITLVDAVGNETVYYAMIYISGDGSTQDCAIEVYEGIKLVPFEDPCIDWSTDTTDIIDECNGAV